VSRRLDGTLDVDKRAAAPGGSKADEGALDDLNRILHDLYTPRQDRVDEYIIDNENVYRLNHGDKTSTQLVNWRACTNWPN